MNDSQTSCPKCKASVVPVQFGQRRVCPQCGHAFGAVPPPLPRSRSGDARSVFSVLAIVALILGAIFLVGLGVLYVGCSQMAGGL